MDTVGNRIFFLAQSEEKNREFFFNCIHCTSLRHVNFCRATSFGSNADFLVSTSFCLEGPSGLKRLLHADLFLKSSDLQNGS